MKRLRWFGIFAASLLALVQTVHAQSSYKVGVGDTLAIEVLQDPALNRSATVLPDGSFSFPFAGALPAAGRTIGQIQNSVGDAISSNFASRPDVFVSVMPKEKEPRPFVEKKPRVIDIYFLGEVETPGTVELKPRTTLLQAMAVAGGVSRFAATKRIQLRRTDASGQQRVTIINFKALQNGAGLNQDIELQDGDVILVPERRLFEFE